MRMRILSAAAAAACLAAGALTACTSNNPYGSSNVPTVVFWYSATDSAASSQMNSLVGAYNQAQAGRLDVQAVAVDTDADLMAKYQAAATSGTTPALLLADDADAGWLVASGQTVPMQDVADAQSYGTSDIQPAVAAHYTVAGKLQAMPFTASVPVLFYNKDAFTKAGLNAAKPPTTLAQVRADAQKLKKSGVTRSLASPVDGWLVEAFNAADSALYCSPDNGRGTASVTQMTFDNATTVQTLAWWQQMVNDGLASASGQDASAAQSAFTSGSAAMLLGSSDALPALVADAQFTVGVGSFPALATPAASPLVSGTALWISGKGHSQAEQDAALDLVKFLVSAPTQSSWQAATGNLPVSAAALTQPGAAALAKQYPQLATLTAQLATKATPATQGCVAPVLSQSRAAVGAALQTVLSGTADPTSTLTAAAAQMTQQLSAAK